MYINVEVYLGRLKNWTDSYLVRRQGTEEVLIHGQK